MLEYFVPHHRQQPGTSPNICPIKEEFVGEKPGPESRLQSPDGLLNILDLLLDC